MCWWLVLTLYTSNRYFYVWNSRWRLGLERADSAHDAVKVITKLVDEHGLFTGKDADPEKPAEAGFVICDRMEAWVVEVSGRHWVAERITSMDTGLISF